MSAASTAFRPGYWGPHVGFYGGVNYGFGYNGAGYAGGRWDNGRFFYNSTVNNLGAARVASVYAQTVARNETINRASFNGGPGGIAAKPTSEELLAENEPRVRPSRLQVDQARAASMRGGQFVSTNQGKPPIAATPRSGEFEGRGAVPARAAGKAAEAPPPPGANPETEKKEKPPAVEKLMKPEGAPNAPKVGEKPPAVEKLIKPDAAPNTPKIEERRPAFDKSVRPGPTNGAPNIQQRTPGFDRPIQPGQPNAPAFQQRPPEVERSMPPGPSNGAPRFDRPPGAQPRPQQQPERRPEARECGRPGLPPCPR